MGIEGIAEQIEMPFGKHVCHRYVDYKAHVLCTGLDECDLPLGGSSGNLADFVLIRGMVHRSLLLGLEGRNSVSNGLSFTHSELSFYIHYSYIIEKLPEGGVGGYGWDDGQGDD
jgi:hypothetical protein